MSEKTIFVHEPNNARCRLYAHHLRVRGLVVTHEPRNAHHAALVSIPADVSGRRDALQLVRSIMQQVPVVAVDEQPYNDELFAGMPLRAHKHRAVTSMRELLDAVVESVHA